MIHKSIWFNFFSSTYFHIWFRWKWYLEPLFWTWIDGVWFLHKSPTRISQALSHTIWLITRFFTILLYSLTFLSTFIVEHLNDDFLFLFVVLVEWITLLPSCIYSIIPPFTRPSNKNKRNPPLSFAFFHFWYMFQFIDIILPSRIAWHIFCCHIYFPILTLNRWNSSNDDSPL